MFKVLLEDFIFLQIVFFCHNNLTACQMEWQNLQYLHLSTSENEHQRESPAGEINAKWFIMCFPWHCVVASRCHYITISDTLGKRGQGTGWWKINKYYDTLSIVTNSESAIWQGANELWRFLGTAVSNGFYGGAHYDAVIGLWIVEYNGEWFLEVK